MDEAYTKGRNSNWERLFTTYDPLIQSIIRWSKWNFSDDEQLDVRQNAYMQLQSALPTFKQQSSLSWFIKRIVIRQCVDEIRRKARWQSIIARSTWTDEEVPSAPSFISLIDDALDHASLANQSTTEELIAENNANNISVEIHELNSELFKYLEKHPESLYSISPRRFEEIVAAILEDMGCNIMLTPRSRDKGRDILAVFNTPMGELLTIIECKRYKPENKIGIDVVERFLWTITQTDKASCGLIATTSSFSAEANAVAQKYKYQLKLTDFERLKEWIAQYGNWEQINECGIWIPKNSERGIS